MTLTLIRPGDFRRSAGELALGQPLGAEAAANVYFLSDLDAVFERFGERGYRVAQMAGGVAGGDSSWPLPPLASARPASPSSTTR